MRVATILGIFQSSAATGNFNWNQAEISLIFNFSAQASANSIHPHPTEKQFVSWNEQNLLF